MPMLERSATVTLPVDEAQKKWTDFTERVAAQAKTQQAPANGGTPTGDDPGQVLFNEAGDGKTEVTIKLNSQGISNDDEATLNSRVDSYLEQFKSFAEQN